MWKRSLDLTSNFAITVSNVVLLNGKTKAQGRYTVKQNRNKGALLKWRRCYNRRPLLVIVWLLTVSAGQAVATIAHLLLDIQPLTGSLTQ